MVPRPATVEPQATRVTWASATGPLSAMEPASVMGQALVPASAAWVELGSPLERASAVESVLEWAVPAADLAGVEAVQQLPGHILRRAAPKPRAPSLRAGTRIPS